MEEKCGEQKQRDDEEEEATVFPPGFRFHPTDEELVGFYLLRKVQGKSINLDFITHLDIYKYHPWDLPRMGRCGGEKERYFMCMRGRKYRNSMRPNRVTVRGCGFWKASGIDKEVDASTSANHSIIGLKKSLVYYQGIAGRGTKTDWMMHEYRFPPTLSNTTNQQAEVWTICRIFKKNASSNKKCTKPNWENTINNKTSFWEDAGETNSGKDSKSKEERENIPEEISIVRSPTVILSSSLGLWAANDDEFFRNEIWDELGSVVGLGLERPFQQSLPVDVYKRR